MPFRSFTSTLDLAEQNCAANNRAGKHACHSAEKSVLAFFCTVAYREPLRFGVASHGPKAGQSEQFTDVLVARGLPVCRFRDQPCPHGWAHPCSVAGYRTEVWFDGSDR